MTTTITYSRTHSVTYVADNILKSLKDIIRESGMTAQQKARLRRVLQASDAAFDGATQKQIAEVLFRTGHLDRDEWQVSSARFST